MEIKEFWTRYKSKLIPVGLYFAAAFGFYILLWFAGVVIKPDLAGNAATSYTQEELAHVNEMRNMTLDTEHPPRVQVEVDYSQGKKAKWYPKNEAPILKELVAEGKLPPVAERVGPEPVVLRGCDGIGKYGGTWFRILSGEPAEIGNRFSYANWVRFSPYGEPIVPHIAKKIDVSDDCRTYTFHLRKGMKWSDGHPFTTDDIFFWWYHDALDTMVSDGKGAAFKTRNEPPKEMVQIDKYTFRVTLAYPNGMLLAQLASFWGKFMLEQPKHYMEKYHPATGDSVFIAQEMAARSVASPYALYRKVRGWNNPERPTLNPWLYNTFKTTPPYEFVRNPYYFAVDEEGNQLPYVDRLVYDSRKVEMIPIAAAAGEITMQSKDMAFDQYTNLMRSRKTGGYEVYHWLSGDGSDYKITPNMNRKWDPGNKEDSLKALVMQEKAFRQALSLSINRKDIIKAEYNNITEPAQVAPGKMSFFYDSTLYCAYTEFDTVQANDLLDGLGLTNRDAEGYRTFPDGTTMLFYMIFTSATGAGPAQFLIEDWADVGIRVLPRERSSGLFTAIRRGRRADLVVGIANGEHYPILEPYNYIPVNWWTCSYALGWATWVSAGGMYGSEESKAKGIPLPRDHVFYHALQQYEKVSQTSDVYKQREIFQPIMRLAAENLWTINICSPPPILVIVKNGFKNVPRKAVFTWPFQTPGNAGVETYYFEKPSNSPGAIAQTKKAIVTITPAANTLTAKVADASSQTGKIVFRIFAVLIAAGLLVLAILKQPYIARRLLIMIPTLIIISIIAFTIIQLPPGDYITTAIAQLEETGEGANQQMIEDYKTIFYLEDSMPVRYLRWLGIYWFTSFESKDAGLLQGNLGTSMAGMAPVNSMVGDRILLTFLISLGTILFTWVVAIPIGIYSAVKQYSLFDYILTFLGFIGMCVPAFLLALVLMSIGGVSGLFSAEYGAQPEWDWAKFIDLMKHIWIPIIVLGIGGTAGMIRVMRGNLLDELKKPYVITAMAKGVRPIKLLFKYPVRLALNPFISGIGGIFPTLVSGGAIVAMVLSLPTVGPMMLTALMSEDMYLAGSMLMVLSLLGIIGTLVSDLLLLWVDPRIRFKSGSR